MYYVLRMVRSYYGRLEAGPLWSLVGVKVGVGVGVRQNDLYGVGKTWPRISTRGIGL